MFEVHLQKIWVVNILDKTYLQERVDQSITETEKTQNIQNMLLYEILTYTKAMAPKEYKTSLEVKCEHSRGILDEVQNETIVNVTKSRKTTKGRE